jgi:hypothetical protein
VVGFGMVSRAAALRLPRMQSWVGEVRFDDAICAVTLMLYGGAALTVVCTELTPRRSGERRGLERLVCSKLRRARG